MISRSNSLYLNSELDNQSPIFIETLKLIEQLHYQLIDAITCDLRKHDCREINAIQALLLYNIGDKELTAGELRLRGCYYGSNVTYNVKKLVASNYLNHTRSRYDRRSVKISLTPQGRKIYDIVSDLYKDYSLNVTQVSGLSATEFHMINASLNRLSGYWTDQIVNIGTAQASR